MNNQPLSQSAPSSLSGNPKIRWMQPQEAKQVKSMIAHSFPLLMRMFLSMEKTTLVAELEGQLLGACILKTFPLPRGEKGGLVAWIAVNREARGFQLGQRLTESALSWFQEQGCTRVYASVEGNNTSSSELFRSRDFQRMTLGRLIKIWGLGALPILFHSFHLFDLGHDLWSTGEKEYQEHPLGQWLANLFLGSALFLISRLWHLEDGFPWYYPISALVALFLLFGSRDIAISVTARSQGLRTQFRLWDTGLFITAMAAAFGGFFPSAGQIFPKEQKWRYKDRVRVLGPAALAGSLSTLLVSFGVLFLPELGLDWTLFSGWPALSREIYLAVSLIFVVTDLIVPVFPFYSSSARRIWDWSKPAWVLIAALGGFYAYLLVF